MGGGVMGDHQLNSSEGLETNKPTLWTGRQFPFLQCNSVPLPLPGGLAAVVPTGLTTGLAGRPHDRYLAGGHAPPGTTV